MLVKLASPALKNKNIDQKNKSHTGYKNTHKKCTLLKKKMGHKKPRPRNQTTQQTNLTKHSKMGEKPYYNLLPKTTTWLAIPSTKFIKLLLINKLHLPTRSYEQL